MSAALYCTVSQTTKSFGRAGKPTFTTSNEGVRMLFVNPYDCEAPATTEATWVIELDESETVYSFQLAVTDANMIDNAGESQELWLAEWQRERCWSLRLSLRCDKWSPILSSSARNSASAELSQQTS